MLRKLDIFIVFLENSVETMIVC